MIVDKSRPFIAERTAYELLSLLRALLEKGVKPNEYHRLLMGRGQLMILSRLVDTFISKISLTMLPVPKPHNTACVLSWEEARRWQSRSSGYSSS